MSSRRRPSTGWGAPRWNCSPAAAEPGPHLCDRRQEWRDLPTWPPATDARVLYLQPDGGLGGRPTSVAAPTTFTYDPADPTPAVGGRRINPAVGGYRDNRGLERRADVLTFTSPPLVEPLEVIEPDRRGARDRQSPCRSLRPRVRSTDERSVHQRERRVPRLLDPESPSGTISIRLDAVAHRFAPGARIRLQILEERIRVTRATSAPTRTRRPAATSHRRGAESSMATAAFPPVLANRVGRWTQPIAATAGTQRMPRPRAERGGGAAVASGRR